MTLAQEIFSEPPKTKAVKDALSLVEALVAAEFIDEDKQKEILEHEDLAPFFTRASKKSSGENKYNPEYGTEEFNELQSRTIDEERQKARRFLDDKNVKILCLEPDNSWDGEEKRKGGRPSLLPYKKNVLGFKSGTGIAQWEDENGKTFHISGMQDVFVSDEEKGWVTHTKKEMPKKFINALYCEIVERIAKERMVRAGGPEDLEEDDSVDETGGRYGVDIWSLGC